jgi:RsiW-degrading membrane proteinase PrsW (M82 family)
MSVLTLLARATAAPFTHALFSVPWGLGLSALLFRKQPSLFFNGLAASILAHAVYDLLLASPGVPQIAVGLVVLVLWLAMIQLISPAHAPLLAPVRMAWFPRRGVPRT